MKITSRDIEEKELERLVDEDYIIDLYLKAKSIQKSDPKEYRQRIKVCKKLTNHIGEWLIL